MKKLVLLIALLGSGVNLLSYGANPVENGIVVENHITADDDLVQAFEVESSNGLPLYFETSECAQLYLDQFPLADPVGWTRVEENKVIICLETPSTEETS